MNCVWCGKEVPRKSKYGVAPKYCDRYCYWKWYYSNNKDHYNTLRCEYHKRHYVPHPLPKKYQSEEERNEVLKSRAKDYYYKNKDYYRQRNYEWYLKHKDDPEVKRRHALAMKKYNEKRKLLKESEYNNEEQIRNIK